MVCTTHSKSYTPDNRLKQKTVRIRSMEEEDFDESNSMDIKVTLWVSR